MNKFPAVCSCSAFFLRFFVHILNSVTVQRNAWKNYSTGCFTATIVTQMFSIGGASLPHYELALHFYKFKKFNFMQFICNKNSGTKFFILKLFWYLRESQSFTTFALAAYWWQQKKQPFVYHNGVVNVLAELTLRRVSLDAPSHNLTSKNC